MERRLMQFKVQFQYLRIATNKASYLLKIEKALHWVKALKMKQIFKMNW